MAAATNKSFDQAVEALIDAQTGELERLKEFGITKAKILEQGEKMFSGGADRPTTPARSSIKRNSTRP